MKKRISTFFSTGIKEKATSEIYDRFIAPFTRHMIELGGTAHPHVYIDKFFHSEDRKIIEVEATRSFKMPGKYLKTVQKQLEGYGPREVEKGTRCLIRLDRTVPEVIDVEVLGDPNRWFKINKYEFNYFLDRVKNASSN